MAIGWLGVLQTVPWGDVITNAPKIADGARKLWQSVGRKAEPPPGLDAPAPTEAHTFAALEARLAAAEARAEELHARLLDSSALIRALADLQQQLVALVEAQRRRMQWLVGASLALGAAGLALALLQLARGG